MAYTKPMQDLIKEFTRFPGVGKRSAERMAFHILRSSPESVKHLASVIKNAKSAINYCKICNNLCEGQLCEICQNQRRDKNIVCVVETPRDVVSIESSGEFQGVYHVLLGALSPLDNIGPGDLKIQQLCNRVESQNIQEVVLALSSGMEGEATALYIIDMLKPLGVRLTRIASGVPVGVSLEYADSATLSRAFEDRREI